MSGVHESIRVKVVDLLRSLYKELTQEMSGISEKYRLIGELLDHDPTILIQQEVRVGDTRERVDMVLGSIVFELKSEEREFEEGKEKAEREYLPRMPNAKYFVLTNYDKWSIYRVERNEGRVVLEAVAENVDLEVAKQRLKDILTKMEPKVPAIPENIQKLFTMNVENLLKNLRDAFDALSKDARVKSLYNIYEDIMSRLYSEASDDFYVDLFVRHTLMHMIVLASLATALGINGDPEDLCRGVGLGIDVALPYLNWWWAAFVDGQKDLRERLSRVAGEVVHRVELLDWGADTAEDTFRLLYEVLIDEETRRKIGEYHTPLWLVDLVLNHFDLRGKIVLDPFCGSGTFLVRAFHRKVDAGEDPDEAYSSLVGFDINPLAVAIARAELVLAYRRRTGRNPDKPPHIYHTDTLAAWLGKTFDPLNMQSLLVELRINASPREILDALVEIERVLTNAVRIAYLECERDFDCLKRNIEENLEKANVRNNVTHYLLNAIKANAPERLASDINQYGGNGVQALALISSYAPKILERFKPDIIVTNPPWIPTTDFKAEYAEDLKNKLAESLQIIVPKKRMLSVLNGSDVAIAALSMALERANEGVGFVMNREQAFYARSPMPAGILATYAVLKHKGKGYIELIDVDFDAFQHGIYPAVVISKQGDREALYVLSVKEEYRRDYKKSLVGEIYQLKRLDVAYDKYIEPSLLYFSKDFNKLAKALGASRIIPKGQYIMGIFGGERKKKEKYAGLALHKHYKDKKGGKFKFELWNTETLIDIPLDVVKIYGVNVYELIYVGDVNPFCVARTYYILLSSNGETRLKDFLDYIINNYDKLKKQDAERIKELKQEAKQGKGSKVETLSPRHVYVVYRSDRAFTASVFKPKKRTKRTVLDSHLAAIELNDEDMAHYYAAVLNYLAYKVRKSGRVFIHHQFGRPPLAVYVAGLAWNNVDPEIRSEVANQAKKLAAQAKQLATLRSSRSMCKKFANMAKALDELEKTPEFKKIVELLDNFIKNKNLQDKLEQALELVSGASKRGG